MTNCYSFSVESRLKVAQPPMFSKLFVLTFSLLLSLPILFLLSPQLFPPSSFHIPPADEQDDLSLFRRASASLSVRPSTYSHLSSRKANLKIAFLFLTNTDLYFSPLWDRFFGEKNRNLYNVYVHADPTSNVTRPQSGVFKDRFIDHAKRTYRASPTLVSATRRLLATAILDDSANVYFAVVSQYCIPIHSFNYVYNSLLRSSTFDHSASPSESTHGGVRIFYKSFIEILSNEPQMWKRYVARGRYTMLPEVPFEDFRIGSQFFILTRKHAALIIRDRKLWKKFMLPCYRENECYPEEHYFPTLLAMNDLGRCSKYTLTNVNWTGTTDGHPYTYKPSEINPELIHSLRISNHSDSYLFARKFSPGCLEPLEKIADKFIFQD